MESFLPPLRRKILRGFLSIVSLYGVIGFCLFSLAFWIATNLTPRAVHRNYDSIQWAIEMRESLAAIRHPGEHAPKDPSQWSLQFQTALNQAKRNITEPGEQDIVTGIDKMWEENKKTIPTTSEGVVTQIEGMLSKLIDINRLALYRVVEETQELKNFTFSATIVFFLIGLVMTLFRADSFALELAEPLKRIAEILRNKPKPGTKLKLPLANSLEVRILTQEIRSLWERVSEAEKHNLEHIMKQSQKLQAVLASIDDAVLVLEQDDIISHCNERMAELVGVKNRDLIIGRPWSDL